MLRKLIGAISGAAFGIVEGSIEGWRIGWKKQHIAGGFLTPYIVIGFCIGLLVGFEYTLFSLPSKNVVLIGFYTVLSMLLLGCITAFLIAITLASYIERLGGERHIFKEGNFSETEEANQ